VAIEEAEEANRNEQQRIAREQQAALQQIDQYLADENPLAAATLYQKLAGSPSAPQLSSGQLEAMINGLHAAGRPTDSLPLMEEYALAEPQQAGTTRLKMAQICVEHAERPAKALELLAAIQPDSLPPKLEQYRRQLAARAEELRHVADLELED